MLEGSLNDGGLFRISFGSNVFIDCFEEEVRGSSEEGESEEFSVESQFKEFFLHGIYHGVLIVDNRFGECKRELSSCFVVDDATEYA